MNILGNHFEKFVQTRIGEDRYTNSSEVIRAGLRLLEQEKQKFYTLQKAIQDGIYSGVAEDFDPKTDL
ncbi:MAG: type II toxin-antitoxin system ParD family antitoxin [Saprospiraceae bacterium]|nr:type II toxin-antitoxin system ParD family antitoxin [Saprospiraceae bacterium]